MIHSIAYKQTMKTIIKLIILSLVLSSCGTSRRAYSEKRGLMMLRTEEQPINIRLKYSKKKIKKKKSLHYRKR